MQKRFFSLTVCAALASVFPLSPASAQQSAMDQFSSVYGSRSSTTGAPDATPGGPAVSLTQVEKIGHKLDIVGVYLGMPVKAAIATVHAHSPGLAPEPTSFKMSDVPDQTFTTNILFRSHTQEGAENIGLNLTTQPMQPVIMSVSRYVMYTESNHPTLAATIAAFRAKYGQESTSIPKDVTNTYNYFWIYDRSGQQLTGQAAKMISSACAGISNDMKSSILEGFDGRIAGQDCSEYSYLRAEIEEWGPRRTNRLGQSEPPGLVFQMRIIARSIPLQIAGSDATRKMLFAARAARQVQQKKAASQNKPVL
jgi:hypothetical protein